jgi:hypothetical protein
VAAERPHVFDLDPAAMQSWCAERGLPKFAAAQVERIVRDSAGQNRTQTATQLGDEEPF